MWPPNVGIVEPRGDESLRRIGADSLAWLAGLLIEMGLPFEVLGPVELREEVHDLGVRRAARRR